MCCSTTRPSLSPHRTRATDPTDVGQNHASYAARLTPACCELLSPHWVGQPFLSPASWEPLMDGWPILGALLTRKGCRKGVRLRRVILATNCEKKAPKFPAWRSVPSLINRLPAVADVTRLHFFHAPGRETLTGLCVIIGASSSLSSS